MQAAASLTVLERKGGITDFLKLMTFSIKSDIKILDTTVVVKTDTDTINLLLGEVQLLSLLFVFCKHRLVGVL